MPEKNDEKSTQQDLSEVSKRPLELSWVCGVNPRLGFVDLTQDDEHTVAYANKHIVVIQTINTKKHFPLVGHRNIVQNLAVSPCKRWLASSEIGSSASVIIWDVQRKEGLQTIDTRASSDVVSLSFSTDSATLFILYGDSRLTMWRWADDMPLKYEDVQLNAVIPAGFLPKIRVNSAVEDNHECAVITFPNKIVILTYHSRVETVNEDGDLLKKQICTYNMETLLPDDEENDIGTMRDGWALGESVFVSQTEIATSLGAGYGAVLMCKRAPPSEARPKWHWRCQKLIRFSERPITTIDKYATKEGTVVAIADLSGHIRFLSSELKLLYWVKKPKLVGCVCLRFAELPAVSVGAGPEMREATLDQPVFEAPPFVTCTSEGVVHQMINGAPTMVFEGPPKGHVRVKAHPFRDLVIISGDHELRLMSLEKSTFECLCSVKLASEKILSIEFSSAGHEVAVGISNGQSIIYDAFSLKEHTRLQASDHAVVVTTFNDDGNYFAAADASHAVNLWERDDASNPKEEWRCMGRFRPHSEAVQSLLFIQEYGTDRLLSISKDRKLVEYAIEDKLKIHSQYRIETEAIPTNLVKYPASRDEEEFLLTTNDRYKFRFYNQSTKLPRRMISISKYDSPITQLISRPCSTDSLAFSTETSLGVVLLPLDGNPNKEYAVVANPAGITSITAIKSSILSCGEGIVTAWNIDLDSLEEQKLHGGVGMTPFYNMLKPDEFELLKDVFYFCRLEEQGLDAEVTRDVARTIPLNRIAEAVRALGWFPTEQQVEELLTEIKFSQFHKTQKQVKEIELDDFIKFYVNHKPADQICMDDVQQAFETMLESEKGDSMTYKEFRHNLENFGEKMSSSEISKCIEKLCGMAKISEDETFDPQQFITNILKL